MAFPVPLIGVVEVRKGLRDGIGGASWKSLNEEPGSKMDRVELGLRMQSWHSSLWDPIYMVGSLYYDGEKYPDPEIVESALRNLQQDMEKKVRMLKGEKISAPTAYGTTDDLRKFAGFTDQELVEDLAELEEIVAALEWQMKEDYQK